MMKNDVKREIRAIGIQLMGLIMSCTGLTILFIDRIYLPFALFLSIPGLFFFLYGGKLA